MVTRYIDIDKKWGVILVYDFDVDYEYDDLSAIMRTFGLNIRNTNKALRVLATYNSGMAISRDDIRMSVIFIGHTTSKSEFWSTISHELYHVNNAIIDYYGEDWDGEPPAYLSGYLMRRVVEEIALPCY